MWDERYAEDGFAYGVEPNDFLKERVETLHVGKTLCLAEGEGRNAVFLARQGHDVTAVDQSSQGLAKASELAKAQGVTIATQVADLNAFDLGEGVWDNIVSIWVHMPSEQRAALHARIAAALKPGGLFLLEAYTPAQLETSGTGGPRDADLLMTLDGLRDELIGMEIRFGEEKNRTVDEGRYHHGEAAVVQVIARKG